MSPRFSGAQKTASKRLWAPALIGQDTDGNGTVQPVDLLPVLAPEWLEHPFADEMIDDLLAILDQGLACPLPRTAGLPNGRATVVLTSDQDYADDSYLLYMAGVLEKHRFAATFMLTHRNLGAPADLNVGRDKPALVERDTVTELLAAGFGLGIHPSLLSVDDMARVTEALAGHTATRPLVARNHWVRWPGYLDVPMAEARAGIGPTGGRLASGRAFRRFNGRSSASRPRLQEVAATAESKNPDVARSLGCTGIIGRASRLAEAGSDSGRLQYDAS